MSVRGRLVALAVVITVAVAGFIAVLLSTRTANCTVVVQRPSLPPALRALGDFDQAYDASQPEALKDAAERAAAAEYPDLIGSTPETPVPVAGTGTSPSVLVVPLRQASTGSGTPPLAGLVVFARDCQGGAYFQGVEDDVVARPPLTSFPPVSRAAAAARLGTDSLTLEYTSSPLQPVWVAGTSPAASMAAR